MLGPGLHEEGRRASHRAVSRGRVMTVRLAIWRSHSDKMYFQYELSFWERPPVTILLGS